MAMSHWSKHAASDSQPKNVSTTVREIDEYQYHDDDSDNDTRGVTTCLLHRLNFDGPGDRPDNDENVRGGVARPFPLTGSRADSVNVFGPEHRTTTLSSTASSWWKKWSSRSRQKIALSFPQYDGTRDRYTDDEEAVFDSVDGHEKHGKRSRLHKCHRTCRRVVLGTLIMLGVFQIFFSICSALIAFFPDTTDRLIHDAWKQPDGQARLHGADPTHQVLVDIASIPRPSCHSHNDYWRRKPLFSALEAGCSGVEADVWLHDDDLYVGHHPSDLRHNKTLQTLYINPLLNILEARNPQLVARTMNFDWIDNFSGNGVFQSNPEQTLVLLIDYKTDGDKLWPVVSSQLQPLRERGFLTYFNGTNMVPGPVTVVATGNAPFNLVIEDGTYRDIFFDAPLDVLAVEDDITETQEKHSHKSRRDGQGQTGFTNIPLTADTFNMTNSYYASVSFHRSIGLPVYWLWPFAWLGSGTTTWAEAGGNAVLSPKQVALIRKQIAGAHQQGLKVRYWNVPAWPQWVRARVWKTLVEEGADYLNIDDLKAGARGGGDWWWW